MHFETITDTLEMMLKTDFNTGYAVLNKDYYNKIHQEKLELSDAEKQKIFDSHRHIRVLPDIEDMKKWNEYVKLQREMGKKDWEIF